MFSQVARPIIGNSTVEREAAIAMISDIFKEMARTVSCSKILIARIRRNSIEFICHKGADCADSQSGHQISDVATPVGSISAGKGRAEVTEACSGIAKICSEVWNR